MADIQNNCTDRADLLSHDLVCLCRSYRHISNTLRLFYKHLKAPYSNFKQPNDKHLNQQGEKYNGRRCVDEFFLVTFQATMSNVLRLQLIQHESVTQLMLRC